MNKVEKIYLLVTIDTECDHDPHWVRSKPLRFESINIGLPQRLQPVFQSTGAIPTYLLTVEVMEDPSCVQTLRSLGGAHEFGTHLHSAFIEPEKKYLDYAGVDSPDFQCHCRPEIEFRKLENLTNLFVACFGRRPKSFRAGRYGAGANTIDALSQLGYALDTSVTPYIRWEHADGDVDYRHAPELRTGSTGVYAQHPVAWAGGTPRYFREITSLHRHWRNSIATSRSGGRRNDRAAPPPPYDSSAKRV